MASTRIIVEKLQRRRQVGLWGAVDKSPSESKRHARRQRRATTRPPDLAGNRSMLDRWPSEFTLDRYQLRWPFRHGTRI